MTTQDPVQDPDAELDEAIHDQDASHESRAAQYTPAPKIARFGNQAQFNKWALHFNPGNKQRPWRAAGRGR